MKDDMTNKDLLALEKLQEIDLRVDQEALKLKEIPQKVEELKVDVDRVGDLLRREKDRLAEMEKWQGDHLRDVTLQSELMGKSKNKLAQSKNEREYKAAQREIEVIKKAMTDREEEVLGLIEAIEQFRKAIEEHEKEFFDLHKHLEVEEAESRQKLAEVEKVITEMKSGREALMKDIPRPVLGLYERIRGREGNALVEVRDGHCTGCNMQLEPQRQIEICRAEKIIQCAMCNRILYLREEACKEVQG